MAKDTPLHPVTLTGGDLSKMSKVEKLKAESDGFFWVAGRQRVPFRSEIDALSCGDAQTISNEAKELSKHFGIYKQQERAPTGSKTGDYIFMARLKLPSGGELSPEQWEALNVASDRFADGTLRLTTRQGIQFHHVYGKNLAALIRFLNAEYRDRGYRMSTLGACGDVNRNTMCSPIDDLDRDRPLRARELAHAIASEMAPRAGEQSYYQVFLSDEEGRKLEPVPAEEPIYGKQYLPRKFKVGIAHPSDNSVDLLTQDVGLLPVIEGDGPEAYDLYSGGGLGVTHNQPRTRQLLGLYLGRIARSQVVDAVKAIATLQKEHGDRKDRRQARWKYTIRRLGLDRVRDELKSRFEIQLREASPAPIPPVRFLHGWSPEAGAGDRRFLVLPVENGRLRDTAEVRLRSAVRRIVRELDAGVRITPNQDLLIAHVPSDREDWVEQVLGEHGFRLGAISRVRGQAFACPAKPTCGLAMTDAENILPAYAAGIEEAGLGDVDVIIRMAGCPNGCSRPPTAEIGIYGYGKNDHVIQVGGSREGTRIGVVLYERAPEEKMIPILTGLLRAVRDHNPDRLPAGEFLHRTPPDKLRELVGVKV